MDHGGSGQAVLLLHGGSAHARWWDFVVPHLGPGVHAVALDLRGHGDSGWAPEGAYRIADYARDVGRAIAALGLERPALVGHSLGSFVALRYAVDHPRDLAAVVVVDGRASFCESGSRYMKLLGMFGAVQYPTLEEAVARFQPLPKDTIAAPEVIAHVARHGFRCDGGLWTTKFDRASLDGHEPFDLKSRLGDLECPVLCVRGERSIVLRPQSAQALVAACRAGTLVEVAGAYHHVLIDRPDVVGREIGAFLRRTADRRIDGDSNA